MDRVLAKRKCYTNDAVMQIVKTGSNAAGTYTVGDLRQEIEEFLSMGEPQ